MSRIARSPIAPRPTATAGACRSGNAWRVGGLEIVAPMHHHVVLEPAVAHRARLGRDQDQALIQQRLDHEAGRGPRHVHHAEVEQAVGELPGQAVGIIGLDAQRHVRRLAAHPAEPGRDQALPEIDLDADAEGRAQALGQGDLLARLLPGAHRGERVALELPAGGGQLGAAAGAHEQFALELLLERLDPRAHGRLADVQPLGRAVEVGGRRDLEEGAHVLDVHRRAIGFFDRRPQ